MTKRYRKAYLQFRDQLSKSISIGKKDDQDDEVVEEVTEEIRASLYSENSVVVNEFGQDVIRDNEVMSKDDNGNVLSDFGSESWCLHDKDGVLIPYNFGKNHPKRNIDFNDPLTNPLILIQKLLLFVVWPQKNLTAQPLSPTTLKGAMTQNLYLIEWFYTEGWFLSTTFEINLAGKNLVTSKIIKSKIQTLISNGENYTVIDRYVKAIKRWLILGNKPYCPDWFKPQFSNSRPISKWLKYRE